MKGRNLVVLVDASASMQATDVARRDRLDAAKEEVKKIIRGLGGADRMLIAQMDAAVTPLRPMSGDTTELERALDTIKRDRRSRRLSRAALRFAADSVRGADNAGRSSSSRRRARRCRRCPREVHVADDVKLTYLPIGEQRRNVGITAFSVRRYPLDKSRYEVMLEVTNTGARAGGRSSSASRRQRRLDRPDEAVRLKPGRALAALLPEPLRREAHARGAAPGATRRHARRPARGRPRLRAPARAAPREGARRHARATRISRPRCSSTSTSTSRSSRPRTMREKIAPTNPKVDVVIFDGATPSARRARTRSTSIHGARLAGEGRRRDRRRTSRKSSASIRSCAGPRSTAT